MQATRDNPAARGSSTCEQRGYIVRLAHQRGMDVGDVRQMAPPHCGESLRNLSKLEASVLIDALKNGTQPDYSKRPRWSRGPKNDRPRRLPKGVARQPTIDQLEMDRELVEWLAHHYGTTVGGIEKKLATKHYRSHGGPMNVIRTSSDCVERIELMKAIKAKAIAAAEKRRAG